jgi:peptide-methionine (S)-S-oxide reductase
MFWNREPRMPAPGDAPVGRDDTMSVPEKHFVNGARLSPPFPAGSELALFGLGCFWGAERKFWEVPGVISTSVGYAAGHTKNPTYREVCSGRTGHGEVVRVVFDPAKVSYEQLLRVFFESHNPTQGMRQGNDVGTQYRSGIYATSAAQKEKAKAVLAAFDDKLRSKGFDKITTEIEDAPPFYYAEEYHQQYLAKNPNGYCGLGGTGVACPVGIAESA